MTEKRTDLALEARESFTRNHVEIQGVVLEKKKCLQGKVKITTVIIRDEAGSKAMKKPKGTYITIESPLMLPSIHAALQMLDAHPHGKGLGLHKKALTIEPFHRVPGAVAQR